MKKSFLVQALAGLTCVAGMAASENSHAAGNKHLRCFARYFGAAQVEFQLEADLASSERLDNVKALVQDSSVREVEAILPAKNAKPPKYKGYRAFVIDESRLALYLPANVFERTTKFDGYAEERLADGNSGHYRLLCKVVAR